MILGTRFSGRRAALLDLISRGVCGEPRVAVMLSESEGEGEFDSTIKNLAQFIRYSSPENAREIVENLGGGADVLFFVADSYRNLADSVEDFKKMCDAGIVRLVRIIGVFDCALYASDFDGLAGYFDAVSHFSDCVLLSNRSGVKGGDVNKIRKRYEAACAPHIFQLEMKDGRLENPAAILVDEARRLSMAFDDYDPLDELELDEDTLPEEPFSIEKKPDPYFERLENGARAKPVLDVSKIAEDFKNGK